VATGWTWVPPTTNTDGSAITPGEITAFTIGIRSTTASGTAPGTYPITVNAPPNATSETFAEASLMLTPDTYQSAINTIAGATSSGFTAETPQSQFVISAPVPNPCTSFFVT
jgi:hypothetical protein